jgi:hypothetical protein
MPASLLDTALTWLDRGIAPIPCYCQSKRPKVRWEDYQEQLPKRALVQAWFGSSLTNLGIIVGWGGLVVIDFDLMDLYHYWRSLFPLNTFTVKTHRGAHVYLHVSEASQNYHSSLLDVKSTRGYVLTAPSTHPSGSIYTVLDSSPILSIRGVGDVLPSGFMPKPDKDLEPVHTTMSGPANAVMSSDPWQSAEQIDFSTGDLISRIREKVSIADLLTNAKYSDNSQRWMLATCPFHDDHNPSFWIDTAKKVCGCYAGCTGSKPMDVVNLYSRLFGIGNREAIFALSKFI